MIDCEPDSSPTSRVPALYLDYGADAQICDDGSLEVSDRGMRFRSHWCFEIGTQLSVVLVSHQARLGMQRILLEGIVVWTETAPASGGKCYDTTILFLELPDELRQSLREFSYQLPARSDSTARAD